MTPPPPAIIDCYALAEFDDSGALHVAPSSVEPDFPSIYGPSERGLEKAKAQLGTRLNSILINCKVTIEYQIPENL